MIITSLLDTDLYKFTMMQVVWERFASLRVEYAFKCRTSGVDFAPIIDEIRAEIDALGSLSLTEEELAYLGSIRYIQPEFVASLRGFRLDPAQVRIEASPEFSLRIEGSWLETILFEVPVLAIINELYFRRSGASLEEGRRRLSARCEAILAAETPLRIVEFGTRRRFSRAWQQEVVTTLKERTPAQLIGTSNVHLARVLGLKPFGTMAHELLQAGQALTHPLDSQKFMLEAWMQCYRGDLGIALSDIFGFDAFLRDFDLLFAKAYDGCRHDSGDPFAWGEKLLAHYEKSGIDSRLKTAVFSDGLDIEEAIALSKAFDSRIRTIFGIGTNLTNDLGAVPLAIVLKMVRAGGRPVVKLSDSPGKVMSEDAPYINYLKDALREAAL